MGQELIEKLLLVLGKLHWSEKTEPTEQGRRTYMVSLDQIDLFRGDDTPTLAAALRTLQTADSQPFAFAGVAYALLAAARENDGSYYQPGLDAAMQWLVRAQALAPDETDINMIEALVYVYNGRLADARLILDYLQQNRLLESYYLNMVEAIYWWARGDLAQAMIWFDHTEQAAVTVPQRLRLKAKRGDCYLDFDQADRAIELYREAAHFDGENAWLWHSLSLAYLHKQDYREAKSCNEKALSLRDFAAARELEGALKRRSGTDILGRLFGRSSKPTQN